MRVTILSLFLYGTTAFCQSSIPAPGTAENLARTPLLPAAPAIRDFSKLPPGWNAMPIPLGRHAMPLAAPKILILPKPVDTTRLSNTEIDRKIILHPPPSSIGVEPPGTAMTQNRYPGLRMRPIDSTNSALEAIPPIWPRYRLETIPTQWPMHEMLPVGSLPATKLP
jgi:hypothetical protein